MSAPEKIDTPKVVIREFTDAQKRCFPPAEDLSRVVQPAKVDRDAECPAVGPRWAGDLGTTATHAGFAQTVAPLPSVASFVGSDTLVANIAPGFGEGEADRKAAEIRRQEDDHMHPVGFRPGGIAWDEVTVKGILGGERTEVSRKHTAPPPVQEGPEYPPGTTFENGFAMVPNEPLRFKINKDGKATHIKEEPVTQKNKPNARDRDLEEAFLAWVDDPVCSQVPRVAAMRDDYDAIQDPDERTFFAARCRSDTVPRGEPYPAGWPNHRKTARVETEHTTTRVDGGTIERTVTREEADPTGRKPGEAVDHPLHYGGGDNPYEAVKVIEAWELGFCLGNTVKYISRSGKKDPAKELEDLKKAAWYLAREIKRKDNENSK